MAGHPILALIPIVIFALSGLTILRQVGFSKLRLYELLPLAWITMAGVFSLVTLICGLTGHLSANVLWGLCGAFALPCLLWFRKCQKPEGQSGITAKDIWPLIISLLPLIIILPVALMMPIGDDWDGLSYHLAVPMEYLRQHAIHYVPYDHHSNFPFTVEMWYLWALGAGAGAVGAKLFHWFCSVMCVYTVWVVGRRINLKPVALSVAGLLLSSMPLFAWEAGTAYLDNAFSLAVIWFGLCGYMALTCDPSERTRWTLLGGIVAGISLGIKMTAVSVLPITAISLMIGCQSLTAKEKLRWLGASIGLAIIVGGGWYLKTFVYTGNPVYPYFYGIFGGRNWNAANAELYRQAQQAFGFGRTLLDFVMSPLRMVVDYDKFFDPMPIVGSSGLFGLLVILSMVFWRKLNRTSLAIWCFIGLNWISWFIQMQQIRYLMFLFPLFILVAVKVLDDSKITRRLVVGIIAVQLLVFGAGVTARVQAALPVMIGRESSDAYLYQYGGGNYRSANWLNLNMASTDGVAVYDETRVFYVNRRLIWANPGHHTLIPYDRMRGPIDLCRWFVDHGYQWVWQNEKLAGSADRERWRALLQEAKEAGLLSEQTSFGQNVIYKITLPE